MDPILTDRLELRLPVEADRTQFVGLFGDADFMVFSGGVLDEEQANARFDRMLLRADEIGFAKQPVRARPDGTILGYAGVERFSYEGVDWLEFGWRLVPEARGKGFATEAGRALLDVAAVSFAGEILAMIDPTNAPSAKVATKLGFRFWKHAKVQGYWDDLYLITVPAAPTPGAT